MFIFFFSPSVYLSKNLYSYIYKSENMLIHRINTFQVLHPCLIEVTLMCYELLHIKVNQLRFLPKPLVLPSSVLS